MFIKYLCFLVLTSKTIVVSVTKLQVIRNRMMKGLAATRVFIYPVNLILKT